MSIDCHSPVLQVRDLEYFSTADRPRAKSEGNCSELDDFPQTRMQRPFPQDPDLLAC